MVGGQGAAEDEEAVGLRGQKRKNQNYCQDPASKCFPACSLHTGGHFSESERSHPLECFAPVGLALEANLPLCTSPDRRETGSSDDMGASLSWGVCRVNFS